MDKETNLGQRLQMFREKGKITQQEMAIACGLTKNHISALERGCNKCSAQALISYAKKLNVSIDELTGLPSERNSILPELQQLLAKMDVEQQKSVLYRLQKEATNQVNILPELQDVLLSMNQEEQQQILGVIQILKKTGNSEKQTT
ncbi:helix-turn-helix transcriptional regulator [Roseburia hominis]